MKRALLLAAGLLFVGLAALGVVLPGLPTTPFILLAAGCFAESSPRLHRWLLQNRLFGPLIHHWQESRAIPRRAKWLGLTMLTLVGGGSIYWATELWLRLLIAALLLIPLVILLRLRTVDEEVAGQSC